MTDQLARPEWLANFKAPEWAVEARGMDDRDDRLALRFGGLPPLSARDWSDTATNYRDAAAMFGEVRDAREAARHGHYAARYSARAFEAWLGSHDGAAR